MCFQQRQISKGMGGCKINNKRFIGIPTPLFHGLQEVNDVIQRVFGESQPVPLWRTTSAESFEASKGKEPPLLYSLQLNLQVRPQPRTFDLLAY